jgi:PBSX family phage portal protein
MTQPKARAIVLKDGSVVPESYLDRYATKAESKQLPIDSFEMAYSSMNMVEPLYSPEALAKLMEMNSYHYRAVKTKARDTAGLGWKLIPRDGIDDPNMEQKALVEAFLNDVNPEYSLVEIFDRVMVDYEATGNGYIEVIRDSVDDLPLGLEHIPSHTVRRHRDGDRYAQKRDNRHSFFKPVGIEDDIDRNTGDFSKQGVLKADTRGNEIMHLLNYTPRSDYYGLPDVLPAIGAILGDKERQEYNISFFENHAVPAYAVTVTGTDLDEDTVAQIQQFFQKDIKENKHSTLVLTASKDPAYPDSQPAEFKFEALATEVKEASFTVYRKDNRDEILSAHGVPPYRAGIAETGSLGGSTAVESTEIYKMSIIEPRQQMIEERMNKHILWNAFEAFDWQFEFVEIDVSDEKHDTEMAETYFEMGALSPNEVRKRIGLDAIESPAMDSYYVRGTIIHSPQPQKEVI